METTLNRRFLVSKTKNTDFQLSYKIEQKLLFGHDSKSKRVKNASPSECQ